MNEFHDFFVQLKDYLQLQKQSITVTTADGLSRVLSAVVAAVLAIMMCSILLLLLCFALAYCIGEMLNSVAMGFAVLFGIVGLLCAYVWSKRAAWIFTPLTRLCHDIFESGELDKEKIHKEMTEKEVLLKESLNEAIAPLPKAKNRYEQLTQMFRRGMMVYEGVMFGIRLSKGFRSMFSHRRK